MPQKEKARGLLKVAAGKGLWDLGRLPSRAGASFQPLRGTAAAAARDSPDLPSLERKETDSPVRGGPESPTTVQVRGPCVLVRGGTLQI